MKKLLSFILSIALLSALIIIPANAASFESEDNKYMLMDFSHGMPEGVNITLDGVSVPKTEAISIVDNPLLTRTGSQTALKIDYSKNLNSQQIDINFNLLGLNTNFTSLFGNAYNKWGAYDFCVDYRIDGTISALSFNYTISGTSISDDNTITYDGMSNLSSTDGFSTFSVVNRSASGLFEELTDSAIFDGFAIKPSGQSNDGIIYIDSIYLKPNSTQTMSSNKSIDNGNATLIEFQNKSNITNFGNDIIADTAFVRQFNVSVKIPAGKQAYYRGGSTTAIDTIQSLHSGNSVVDPKTNYEYVNMWVYGTDLGDTFYLFLEQLGGSKCYYCAHVVNDWGKGWKLVSVPFTELTNNNVVGQGVAWSNGAFLDNSKSSLVYGFRREQITNTSATNPLYVNHIWFSKNPPAASEFKILNDNETGYYVDDSVVIELSNPISPVYTDLTKAITVSAEGGIEVPDVSAKIDGNKLILDFASVLEYGTKYTVNISNKVLDYDGQSLLTDHATLTEAAEPGTKAFTFTTETAPDGIKVKGIKLTNGYKEINTLPAAGKIAVTADVYKDAGNAVTNAILLLAVYNGNELENVYKSDAAIDITDVATLTATAEQNFTGKTIKAFILSDLTNIKPLKINLTK